jgi:hypothetical protein
MMVLITDIVLIIYLVSYIGLKIKVAPWFKDTLYVLKDTLILKNIVLLSTATVHWGSNV